jgi:hypothetical protein
MLLRRIHGLSRVVFAQGASEVLHALGDDKLHSVVPQLLPLSNHPNPAPREGLLWLLAFLPSTMGEGFAALIDVALPVVLKVQFLFVSYDTGKSCLRCLGRASRMTLSLCEGLPCVLDKLS